MSGTRFISGIQPSGNLHLGNYFGAIAQHLELQHQGEALFFIANYHALTSLKNAALLRQYTREIAATYLALGLDPEKAILFRQSDVPEVHELAWLLNCVCGVGNLQRCHAYKDKVEKGLSANAGLLTYPVLMAADILIYKATEVPVGQDQGQHLEITRQLAQSFNAAFQCDVLKVPKIKLGSSPLVPGTDGQKMSKSYGNTIPIFGNHKKPVSRIVTDSKNPKEVALDPTTCNAFAIYSLVATPEEQAELAQRYREDRTFLGYGITKKLITEKLKTLFGEAHAEYQRLLTSDELKDILQEGGKKAQRLARETLNECREAAGL